MNKDYTSGSGLKIFPNINKDTRTGKCLKKKVLIQIISFLFHKNIENYYSLILVNIPVRVLRSTFFLP